MSFLRGIGEFGTAWTDNLDLSAVAAAGIDCIRMVSRSTPSYPGGGQAPVFTWTDETAFMSRLTAIMAAGLDVVIGMETTTQENKAMFYRQMSCNTSTGVLAIRADPDYTRFDGFDEDVATAIAAVGDYGTRVLFELYAGEPGAFLRDTAPAAIAAEFLPNGDQGAFATLIDGAQIGDYEDWGHPEQRLFSSRIIQAICEHRTDVIRAIAPDAKIIWPGPGFGSMNGSGANPPYYDMNPAAKTNCRMGAHQYSPRNPFTHSGEGGAAINSPRIWPDPTDTWEAAFTADEITEYNYNWDQRAWTQAELEDNMNDFATWCSGKGVTGIVSEWGCIEENRSLPASQTYISQQRAAILAAGLEGVEWNTGSQFVTGAGGGGIFGFL